MRPDPENSGPPPALELITPINKGRMHINLIYPSYFLEVIADACERAKANDKFEHIIDDTGIVLEEPNLIIKGLREIIKGREKNDMSNIRTTILNILIKNIRDSVRELNRYCQKQHNAAGPSHRCTIELAKGPMVPALDTIPRRLKAAYYQKF